MNGSTPKNYHLKVQGYTCYVLIDEKDPQRYELSLTSRKINFIGHCKSSTQYRIYIPLKPGISKITTSANIKFLEDTLWDMKELLFETTGGAETSLDPDSILTGSDDYSEEESDLDLNNSNYSLTKNSIPQNLSLMN